MPEGDTVYKTAQYLAPRLEGATLVEVEIGGSPLSLAHHCPVVSPCGRMANILFIELSHGRQEGARRSRDSADPLGSLRALGTTTN